MTYAPVTALLPSVRGPSILGSLFSFLNQSVAPVRTIIYDVSRDGFFPDTPEGIAAGWFCERFGVEVHRGTPFTNQLLGRKYLGEQATTPWLWFLDDDLLCDYDCLEQMLATQHRTGVALVAATKTDLVAMDRPWGFRSWNKTTTLRSQDIDVPWADGGNFLIDAHTWSGLNFDYAMTDQGGEDIFLTAQAALFGGAQCSARARCWHLRATTPGWLKRPVDRTWLDTTLQPVLGAAYDAFLRRIGEA